jgi:hypothetical protein
MDKVQKTAFTDYNAPSSKPFRLQDYLYSQLQTNNVANGHYPHLATDEVLQTQHGSSLIVTTVYLEL